MFMDLRHLRYFTAVAEEQHITRAAERIGIQQPPLSQQIKMLEVELGVQLLRRKPRGVELTAAGQVLYHDACAILDEVEAAVARVQRTARGEQGKIALGYTSSAPFHPFVPDVIRAFTENYPLVALELEESGTQEMVDALRSERLDAAFIRSPVSDAEGLSIHPLTSEEMLMALPEAHPLASTAGHISMEELSGEAMVLYRRKAAPGLYDAIISACHGAGFTPAIVQEVPRIISTLNLVAAGLGITLVPQSLRQIHLAGIEYRPLTPTTTFQAPLNLVCRTVDHSQTAKNFVAFVRKSAKELEAAP